MPLTLLVRPQYTAIRDEVFESLVEAIVAGDLAAGTRLIEAEVALQLGVSKTPVREALIRLVKMGLVSYFPRRGTFVAEISLEIIRDIFTLRRLIEGHVTAEATRRATADDLDGLARILDRFAAAQESGSAGSISEKDIAFHEQIYRLSGSKLFLDLWLSIRDQVRLWHRISGGLTKRSLPEGWDYLTLHQPILGAMRSRSPERATEVAQEHIDRAYFLLGIDPIEGGSVSAQSVSPSRTDVWGTRS